MTGRHIYSSRNKDQFFAAEKLREFDKDQLKKFAEELRSEEDKRTNSKEEIEYVFTFASQDEQLKEKLEKPKRKCKKKIKEVKE